MGQSAIGIMYGCLLPEGLDFYGVASGGPDLIFDFHAVIGWNYDSDFRPVSIDGEGEAPVIGVLIAVSGSGKHGAANLWSTRRFADIASLSETIKARETWQRFVAWCKEHQLAIPADAELWIVTTETA